MIITRINLSNGFFYDSNSLAEVPAALKMANKDLGYLPNLTSKATIPYNKM
jgi:hypothetical protein